SSVTGVQTCALPIFRRRCRSAVRTRNVDTTYDSTQGLDRESSPAPSLEPSAERMEIPVTVRARPKGHPSARGLSRLRAVKDDLAGFRNPLMMPIAPQLRPE